MTTEYRMTLPAKTLDNADDGAKAVLERAQAQVGFVPNMYAVMVNSPGLLETYLDGYQRFRKSSGFTPAEQEVVFLTISRANGCAYCMAAHSMLAEKVSHVPSQAIAAIREEKLIADPKLAALGTFTLKMFESRGLPSSADVRAFLAAGFDERHVLEIILALAVKTLSNYANHLFHTPLDDVFAGYAWKEPS